jgi:zinc D-Ala-D-Ala dipeptidase
MKPAYLFLILCISVFYSCKKNTKYERREPTPSIEHYADFEEDEVTIKLNDTNDLERKLIAAGLVNIKLIDSTIRVDLRYADTNNFLNSNLYEGLKRCYLQPDVAERLAKSNLYLKSLKPGYSLLVFDGVRPVAIQWKMWNSLKTHHHERSKFVSNPSKGSLHNFGAAVDISICDENGKELDMGTPFDFMGELAYPSLEEQFLKSGELSLEQVENRKLLRKVMQHSGFWGIKTEWWHFNACSRDKAKELYQIIE